MVLNGLEIHISSPQTHQSNSNYRTATTTTTTTTPIHQPTNPPTKIPKKCPKEVQDATTTTAPNATSVTADGSTYPSVTVQHTPSNVQSTTCLTRHTRLAVCVMVRTILLRERGEINRLVILPLRVVKVRKERVRKEKVKREGKAREVKARKVKARKERARKEEARKEEARKEEARKEEARKVMAKRRSNSQLPAETQLLYLPAQVHLHPNENAKKIIQEIENPSLHHNMDTMVPGHFFPGYPPNMSQGSLRSVDEVFTSTFFFVAGLLVVLFWRIPAV
jgi:hypothetical protein